MRVLRARCPLFLLLSIYMKGQEHRNKTACVLWYLWGFRRSREMFPLVCRESMLFFGTCTVKRRLRYFSSGTLLGNEDILRTVKRNAHLAVEPFPAQTGKDGSQLVAVRSADVGTLLAEAFTPYLHV